MIGPEAPPEVDSEYATTGRPAGSIATEASPTTLPFGDWLSPLPLAEPPSSFQNALTPA
jgi:hypothetical protein